MYRTSTRSSARKIYYYRCLGSDAWRYQGQARCSARAIRLDLLEDTVWTEVARLLEDPALIQAELTRRLEAARTSHPAKQNQDRITRELLLAQRRVERLLTAYQEDLLSLDELRRRMPELRQRETRLKAELESLSAQLADQATYLRLAHTLGEFLERLRTQVQGLDVLERQRVVRLLVKEVVVGDDGITIRHSIPHSDRSSGGPAGLVDPGVPLPGGDGSGASLLLRTWRDLARCSANLALDGLQSELDGLFRTVRDARKHKVNFVRYADDFVITASSKEFLESDVGNPSSSALWLFEVWPSRKRKRWSRR